MLRYIYLLLCLLACIEWTFCYDYISDSNSKHGRVGNDRKVHRRRQRPSVVKRRYREDEGLEEKDPVAEIDVASFIQQPDYDSIDETGRYESHDSRRKLDSNDYENYGALTRDKFEDNLDHDEKNVNLDDSENSDSDAVEGDSIQKSYAENTKLNKEYDHRPKKKFAHLKIPFFSHEKSIASKEKTKKRKIASAPKKQDENQSHKAELLGNLNNQQDQFKLFKRSYEQYLCPMCKKKFTPNINFESRKRHVPRKMIHNSRQYFKDVTILKDAKANKMKKLKENKKIIAAKSKEDLDERRKKREEKDSERERQLKELEEVQRKVESVEVSSVLYSNRRPNGK